MLYNTSKCTLQINSIDNYRCNHPIHKDGLCVYHIRKFTEEEKAMLPANEQAEAESIKQKFLRDFDALLWRIKGDETASSGDFRGFLFPSIDLRKVHFSKKMDFSKAIFIGEADFRESVFEEEAIFSEVTFNREANFAWAVFCKKADFQWAKFHKSANFSVATFEQRANFEWVNFAMSAKFWRATFAQAVRFTGNENRPCFRDVCDFRDVKFAKDASVIFDTINLERATFLDTDLEKINFRDVTWYHRDSSYGLFFGRAQSLRDEFAPALSNDATEADYEKIAENYRQLVLNYEAKRNYDAAENFHIGEMEMRRRKVGVSVSPHWRKGLSEWVNAYGMYKFSNFYGTSYIQAFLVLLLLAVIFPLLFLYAGFRQSKDSALDNQPRVIEYNLLPDAEHQQHVSLGKWIDDYAAASALAFSIITFQKDRFYEPLEGISRFWLYVATFVLTAQTAMVVLAVRRRFKR